MDNHAQLWGYKNAKAFFNAYVPPDVVAKVNAAVLATCDAADGVQCQRFFARHCFCPSLI